MWESEMVPVESDFEAQPLSEADYEAILKDMGLEAVHVTAAIDAYNDVGTVPLKDVDNG